MNNISFKNLIAGAAAFAAISTATPSFAESNFYAGIGVSQAFVDEPGLDDEDTGGKIFGGYRFTKFISVEAAYYDFGEIEDQGSSLDVDGISLALVGTWPINDAFSVFGKVGAHDWDAEVSGPFTAQLSDDSDGDVFYGIGAQYNFNERISVRAEIERYEVDDLDYDVATIGLLYNF